MIDIIKIVFPAILTFFIGIFITPFFTHYFYKYKMWKKSPRTLSDTSEEFAKVHNTSEELKTPRVGGVIIWISVFITVFIIYLISIIFDNPTTLKLNFFSRSQTILPLGAFLLASLIGLADDFLQIFGKGSYAKDPLIYRKIKILFITLIGFSLSTWFYFKLDMNSLHIPFYGDIFIGLWFIPLFILVMIATFSTSVIDGMDGLSGGVLTSIFTAYSIVAFVNNQIDISALCAVISGATLAFLWFNIPPARFYMGETGILGLTVTLSVIAFLTNSVLFLPIIAIPLVATSLSNIIQITSYKLFNKRRVFKVAPLHHHFEALGWSREKIVMRYWVVSVVFAIIGTILVLVG
jgi:phospho-N-acetylmuramoyl-pentapeptide-transferase